MMASPSTSQMTHSIIDSPEDHRLYLLSYLFIRNTSGGFCSPFGRKMAHANLDTTVALILFDTPQSWVAWKPKMNDFVHCVTLPSFVQCSVPNEFEKGCREQVAVACIFP